MFVVVIAGLIVSALLIIALAYPYREQIKKEIREIVPILIFSAILVLLMSIEMVLIADKLK